MTRDCRSPGQRSGSGRPASSATGEIADRANARCCLNCGALREIHGHSAASARIVDRVHAAAAINDIVARTGRDDVGGIIAIEPVAKPTAHDILEPDISIAGGAGRTILDRAGTHRNVEPIGPFHDDLVGLRLVRKA